MRMESSGEIPGGFGEGVCLVALTRQLVQSSRRGQGAWDLGFVLFNLLKDPEQKTLKPL